MTTLFSSFSAQDDAAKLDQLLTLVNSESQPNLNALTAIVKNVTWTNLNLKFFGYALAQQLAAALPVRTDTAPEAIGLASKASTQADMESAWLAHWCGQLQVPIVYHRKLWELAFVLQALFEEGHLRPGARGLGFGCGEEPIPSYLAAQGVAVTMTDLPSEEAQARGWADTGQHAASPDMGYNPQLVSREAFDRLVGLRFLDMNAIPADLTDYDFCWSICALEHLGSIDHGLDFVANTLATLRPGGLSVHTTEFNIDGDGPTIDNWATVLFQRAHLEGLAARLRAEGHFVAPFNFDLGGGPMDHFVDLPPWTHDLAPPLRDWLGQPLHLKVALDGFASTCFGIVVRKAG